MKQFTLVGDRYNEMLQIDDIKELSIWWNYAKKTGHKLYKELIDTSTGEYYTLTDDNIAFILDRYTPQQTVGSKKEVYKMNAGNDEYIQSLCNERTKSSPETFNTAQPTRRIYAIFDKAMSIIHDKGSDYTNGKDWHKNFKYAEMVAAPFPERYKPYTMLIGVKLARLSELLQEGRQAKNEPITDSFIDAMNYIALMAERYEEEKG